MSDVVNPTPTVFDATAVSNLTGHADDRQFAQVLVSRFLQMLPARVRRIGAAIGRHDSDEAMDAVLSLKAASGTLGAGELFELGGRIESHLRHSDDAGATLAAGELPAAAERARRALTAYLET